MASYKKPKKDIDFSAKDYKKIGIEFRKKKLPTDKIDNLLRDAESHSKESVYNFTRGLINSQESKEQFLEETQTLWTAGVKMPSASRKMMLKGVVDEAGRAGSLFIIQNMSALTKKDARDCMKDFLDSGGSMPDIAEWLKHAGHVLRKHNIKASDTAGVVIDALGDAAEWLVDTLEDGVDAILEAVDAILDAATDAGAALVDLFEEVVAWTADQMGNLLAALIEAGRELIEFVGATFDWAYNAVSRLVEGAFAIGLAIADLLETVVSESYFVLRRFINGIIENLGPIGEIFDFILTQVENATSTLWRRALLAIRFAEGNLLDALDWMANQTEMAFNAIIIAWESIGEALMTVYEWALAAGSAVWWAIGEATATIGNSIFYVYNFLRTSGVQFLFDFTRGLLAAGMAVAEFIGWAVDQTIEVAAEIIRAAIDVGVTIGQMLVEIARDPGNALNTFLQAAQDIGQTLDDLLEATLIETVEEFLDEVTDALLEIGNAVLDILEATLRLGGAYLATVIASLLNKLGTYRQLTANERADAELVFGNSLDYDMVFLSNEDPLNAIIFGIQDFFTGSPNSRAFVTGNLINFDPSDNNLDRPTLIHELTHVWQHREIGGIYMAEAIWAQAGNGGNCATGAYNYGYDIASVTPANSMNIETDYSGGMTNTVRLGCDLGVGGEPALIAGNGDLLSFNPEQQGQIIMHWFTRNHLNITDNLSNPVNLPSTEWDPYQQFVFNS